MFSGKLGVKIQGNLTSLAFRTSLVLDIVFKVLNITFFRFDRSFGVI